MYYINRITTGETVSANVLTPMHTQTQTTQIARWSLCRKHASFPRTEENSEEREIEEKSSRDSSTTLRPRQNAIPTQSLLLSFYSPRWEGRYISLHYIYSLSFRTEIRLDFLSNECVLPRILTSADMYLTMYNTTKLVPTCKGRFTHIVHGFRLETVFSTTTRIFVFPLRKMIKFRFLFCLMLVFHSHSHPSGIG